MDNKEIRRRRLLQLKEQYGTWEVLGETVGSNHSYLSQIASPNIDRNMGDRLARQFEKRLGKPRGWMDEPLVSETETLSEDEQRLLERFRFLNETGKRKALSELAFLKTVTIRNMDRAIEFERYAVGETEQEYLSGAGSTGPDSDG